MPAYECARCGSVFELEQAKDLKCPYCLGMLKQIELNNIEEIEE